MGALESLQSTQIGHLIYISLYIEIWRLKMNKPIIHFINVVIASLMLLSLPAFADEASRDENKGTPPGWEQGEKTGWQGKDRPPGLNEEKPKKKQKATMKGEEAGAKVKKEGKKIKPEAEPKEEQAEQEADIEKQKKKREAEIKKEKEKMKSNSKKKKAKTL